MWLINTHNGIRGKLERIHIEDYPAVKAHLNQYWDRISKRADKGDTPYNLRNCTYLEDLYKPKLFYADITQRLNFCICKEVMFCNNTTYFIATKSEETLEYLYKYLNSPIADWYYRTKSVQLGGKAVRMFSIYMLEIPIPPMIKDIETYKLLGLTPTEVAFIEDREINILYLQ